MKSESPNPNTPSTWSYHDRGSFCDLQDNTGRAVAKVYMNDYGSSRISERCRNDAKRILVAANTHDVLVDAIRQAQATIGTDGGAQQVLGRVLVRAIEQVKRQEIAAEQQLRLPGQPTRGIFTRAGGTRV